MNIIVGVVKQITFLDSLGIFSVVVENKNKIKFDLKSINQKSPSYFVFSNNNGLIRESVSEKILTVNNNGIMFDLLLNAYNNRDIVEITYEKMRIYYKNQIINRVISVSIYKEDDI
jgi:hypothetical protein